MPRTDHARPRFLNVFSETLQFHLMWTFSHSAQEVLKPTIWNGEQVNSKTRKRFPSRHACEMYVYATNDEKNQERIVEKKVIFGTEKITIHMERLTKHNQGTISHWRRKSSLKHISCVLSIMQGANVLRLQAGTRLSLSYMSLIVAWVRSRSLCTVGSLWSCLGCDRQRLARKFKGKLDSLLTFTILTTLNARWRSFAVCALLCVSQSKAESKSTDIFSAAAL